MLGIARSGFTSFIGGIFAGDGAFDGGVDVVNVGAKIGSDGARGVTMKVVRYDGCAAGDGVAGVVACCICGLGEGVAGTVEAIVDLYLLRGVY